MNPRIKLSLEKLKKLLQTEGWEITGGHFAKNLGHLKIRNVTLVFNVLRIGTEGHQFSTAISEVWWNGTAMIEIFELVPQVQARKMVDGGGTHEVLVPTCTLRLWNKRIEDETIAANQERIRREEEDQDRQIEEMLTTNRKTLQALLCRNFRGQTVAEIVADEDGVLTLKFEDGKKMAIQIYQDDPRNIPFLQILSFDSSGTQITE